MALVSADRVKETSITTGTGTYNLVGAETGYQGFVAGIGNGNTCYYCATDGIGWEVGIGTVTDAATDTLARTKILASSNSNAAVSWSAGTKFIFGTIAAKSQLPPGHIFGLVMSNAAGDATNDIAVAAGSVRDETDQVDMRLPASITKQIDAAWAVGDAAGGMNTGAVANDTWYEVHVIMRPDTGVVDLMFTTTGNRATLPTNYVYQRRIGWVRRGTATNLAFTQVEDIVTLTTKINDVSATMTTTAAAVTLTAPPNSIARFRASSAGDGTIAQGTDSVIIFSEIVEGNVTPAATSGLASLSFTSGDATAGNNDGSAGGHFELRVDASSQIEHDSSVAEGTFDISALGWIDTRGRFG